MPIETIHSYNIVTRTMSDLQLSWSVSISTTLCNVCIPVSVAVQQSTIQWPPT